MSEYMQNMIDQWIGLWNAFKIPIILFSSVFGLFTILIGSNMIYYSKKMHIKPNLKKNAKIKVKWYKKLFVQFPRMIALDILKKDPDTFKYKGVIIFEGPQGNGKSISMIKCANDMKLQFPKSKCIANLKYINADEKLTDWKLLIDYKNDKEGVIAIIDETQNWFSSKDSRSFPPEMLSVVTQNRKNRRIILGTAQNFYMLSKDIRTQCTEVRSCFTIFGCVTFVLKKRPICDSAGEVKKWKYKGLYWYVHTPELRECYDTYETIERFRKVGFVEKAATNIDIRQYQGKKK